MTSEPRSELAEKLGAALIRLHRLTELEADWDSYGAEPIANTAVINAHKLIAEAILHFSDEHGLRAVPYDLGPLPTGGVQVVWKGPHIELEADIGGEGNRHYEY